jgi:multiple sugar transport system substrate-binding protein
MGRRRFLFPVISAAAVILIMSGCQKKNPYGLSEKAPVTITIWHYYSGVQEEEFERLIRSFNETDGREKGIVVEASNKGSIGELNQKVYESIEKKIGSEPLPDVFAAYADQVYEIDREGLAVDLSKYMEKEELSQYVEAYIEEGRFDGSEGVKVFPIAKSTEVLSVNETDWLKFAEATGCSDSVFSTWEGITKTAKEYYEWTDSLTDAPDDGKAFYGRDAFANYMIVGSAQLGHEIFRWENGAVVLDFDKTAMRKLWDNYYVPYVNGYFSSYGKFRSDDVKTGRLVAFAGSTSGISYFPNTVTLEDGTSYEIKSRVYPLPNFADTPPYAVQQGAGMMILKSEEKREYASVEFLKWFTEDEHNIEFSIASGYLPVKKTAGSRDKIETVLAKADKEPAVIENLLIGLDTANKYQLYTSKPFSGGDKARAVLNNTMADCAAEAAAAVEELRNEGIPREDAVAQFVTDEAFETWYQDTKLQLEAIIGE